MPVRSVSRCRSSTRATVRSRLVAMFTCRRPMPRCRSIAQRPTAIAWTFRRLPRSASSRAWPRPSDWSRWRGRREVHGLTLNPPGPTGRLMAQLSRERYAQLYGPTTGDRIRLADTDLLVRDHRRPQRRTGIGRRRGGVRRRQGAARVDGSGPRDPGRGSTRHRDHGGGDHRLLGNHQGRHRDSRWPHRRDRQGRQSRHHGRRASGPGGRAVHRNYWRQRTHRHRGHRRLSRAPDLPADHRRSARRGYYHDHRRWHRPRRGHQGHHRHPGWVAPGPDAGVAGLLAGELRAAGQGKHRQRRCAVGAIALRCIGFQTA